MIKLQIVGNLGKDCIVKEVNGRNVINFSVVHSERYKDAQGVQKERATWVECAYWTDRTAVAPYLAKALIKSSASAPLLLLPPVEIEDTYNLILTLVALA